MQTPTYLPGLYQRPSAVHVVLRVHDKHHLVGVEFKSTVQTASVFHTQLPVPLSSAAHRLHLPHLPATETTQVPDQRDIFIKTFAWIETFVYSLNHILVPNNLHR